MDKHSKERNHFTRIYGEELADECVKRYESLLRKYQLTPSEPLSPEEKWSHKDQVLITYADMVRSDLHDKDSHLAKLHHFMKKHLNDLISTVHLLPFYPSSSDDGFSVIDYRAVDEQIGGWSDVETFSSDFRLMSDLVINHTSRYSKWFREFLNRRDPYKDYFIEVDRESDLSNVVRPRNSPLVMPVQTSNGETYVWTTFSPDQIDVDFSNIDVLFEYLDIIFFYISKGIKVLRLDAVAYLWKELGTTCIHLPQTHEVVKLIRTIADHYMPEVSLITETNVPHKENISYFGKGDEAHLVYQFSLPPLLLHAIQTQNSTYLFEWANQLKSLPPHCAYFNFTSSHDGIGVRPLEGLVPDEEFDQLVKGVEEKGGFVSYKANADNTQSPYELNITYFDAFKSDNGNISEQIQKYFCSQILMLSMVGVPGIYFHNLTGTRNYHEGVQLTGRYRTINRRKWSYVELESELDNPGSITSIVFNTYCNLIKKRNKLPAFHPMGIQKVFNLGSSLFSILRQSPGGEHTLFVVANVTEQTQRVELDKRVLPVEKKSYTDHLSGKEKVIEGSCTLRPYEVIWITLD